LELIVVIFGTLGMAQASTGINQSMNVTGWIIFWRFFVGVGIGAEYPLSAVITAEFAGVKSRARMMASVFLMQPLGQLVAAAVGWGALVSIGNSRGLDKLPADGDALTPQEKFMVISTIDTIWRCVVGVGAFPALVAIIYRVSIPESPRYTLDVGRDGKQAVFDVKEYQEEGDAANTSSSAGLPPAAAVPELLRGTAQDPQQQPLEETAQQVAPETLLQVGQQPIQQPTGSAELSPNYFTRQQLHDYFWRDGNIRYLAATSLCWFLLDFAFYGLGIGNPRQIQAIWAKYNHTAILGWPYSRPGPSYADFSNGTFPDWENPFNPDTNMYQELYSNALKYTITVSIGSILGSVILIMLINRIYQKLWLVRSFFVLCILFMITGATLSQVEFTSARVVTIIFYMLCQFFFNFGTWQLSHC
jgi:MFS transporter, PHS family, inorganic phosphate transporter